MQHKFTKNQNDYWVTIEKVFNSTANLEVGFIAFISSQEPGIYFGVTVKDSEGKTILYTSYDEALTTAETQINELKN